MAIAEGQFSEVGSYNIKVNKKSGENGNFLTGITIHKKTNTFDGSKNVIRAKNGELVSSDKSSILQLVLNDGFYYEDLVPKNYDDRKKLPFAKSSFKKYIINIDLRKLNSNSEQDMTIKNTDKMLTIKELLYTLDSLNVSYKKDVVSISDNINQRSWTPPSKGESNNSKTNLTADLLDQFSIEDKLNLLNIASNYVVNNSFSIDSYKSELNSKMKSINEHWIAVYEKLVISFSCLLMFFLGAPLGAIIRKGGLGLPLVFAVTIFIIFHFINTFGKKVAQENGITPFLGCWLSTMILLPLAVLLTYRATNDIGLVNMDVILTPIQKFFKKILPSNNN
jgi:lipopolysaccharide export system permease protein